MGKSLVENASSARELYDEAAAVLGWDLAKISFEGPEEELVRTSVCQPALFVHGFAVFSLLRERKLLREVRATLGLSLGEVTALAVAGVFDFATALRIVAERGRLMQEACERTRGSMACVLGANRETVAELCREFDIDMANLNCPGQIVISGAADGVTRAVEAAGERGTRAIPLNVAGAYHSRLMEPARERFAAFLEEIPFNAPQVPVLTNTTGRAVSEPAEIKAALVRQVVSPVLWEDCLRSAADAGIEAFWECGPGGVLTGLARRTNREWSTRSFSEFSDLSA